MRFKAYDPRTAALERVGRTIGGKWTLDRVIDIGGMGAVYAATHRNGHRFAIKMLHASLPLDPFPSIAVESTEPAPSEIDDGSDFPISVVFETSRSRPHSIEIEISDATGAKKSFELQPDAADRDIDELLELPPASVVPGRPGASK
jgi:hypothetical protein